MSNEMSSIKQELINKLEAFSQFGTYQLREYIGYEQVLEKESLGGTTFGIVLGEIWSLDKEKIPNGTVRAFPWLKEENLKLVYIFEDKKAAYDYIKHHFAASNLKQYVEFLTKSTFGEEDEPVFIYNFDGRRDKNSSLLPATEEIFYLPKIHLIISKHLEMLEDFIKDE